MKLILPILSATAYALKSGAIDYYYVTQEDDDHDRDYYGGSNFDQSAYDHEFFYDDIPQETHHYEEISNKHKHYGYIEDDPYHEEDDGNFYDQDDHRVYFRGRDEPKHYYDEPYPRRSRFRAPDFDAVPVDHYDEEPIDYVYNSPDPHFYE